MIDSDVVVAGAGPVGTVTALNLARRGISVTLLEAGPDCAQDLRASTFHPPTLEMLDELGITAEIIDNGLYAPVYHFRERQSGETIAFDLGELADVTRHPYRVQCEQYYLSRYIASRLEAEPGTNVRFNHRVVGLDQADDHVEVAIETPYSIEKLRCRYLVAADGGNSIIRKWLSVDFDGYTYPEKFLCLSTELELADYLPNLCYVNYVSDPDEWLVLLRVPRVWRILLPASPDEPDAQLVSDGKSDDVFRKLIGKRGVTTVHRTIYRMHQRVAKRFDHGRVFLVGDAAHLNNPLGGFGMNSGIHDAWNLCDRIAACLADGHDPASFERFGRQRRSVTHSFIQAQSIQNMNLLKHGSEEVHRAKLEEMRAIQADPAARRAFLMRQSMFSSLEDARAVE